MLLVAIVRRPDNCSNGERCNCLGSRVRYEEVSIVDVESESQLTVVSDSEVTNPIIPRIGHLILAVLIA